MTDTTNYYVRCEGYHQFHLGEEIPKVVAPPNPDRTQGWKIVYDEKSLFGMKPNYRWLCKDCKERYERENSTDGTSQTE